MTAKERKVYNRQRRQAAAKAAKAEEAAKAAGKDGKGTQESEDSKMGGGRGGGRRRRRQSAKKPDGKALAAVANPLAQAQVWIKELVDIHTNPATTRATVTNEQKLLVFLAQVCIYLFL